METDIGAVRGRGMLQTSRQLCQQIDLTLRELGDASLAVFLETLPCCLHSLLEDVGSNQKVNTGAIGQFEESQQLVWGGDIGEGGVVEGKHDRRPNVLHCIGIYHSCWGRRQ